MSTESRLAPGNSKAFVRIESIRDVVYSEYGDKYPADIYHTPVVSVESPSGEVIFEKEVPTHFYLTGIPRPRFEKRLDNAIKKANRIAKRINDV